MTNQYTAKIYANGTCLGSQGAGGWGVVVDLPDGRRLKRSGAVEGTTNHRMDLLAACIGLEALPKDCVVEIMTDSTFLRSAIDQWIHAWRMADWCMSDGAPVKNEALWKRLDAAIQRQLGVTVSPVVGHDDHMINAVADNLATQAAQNLRRDALFDGPDDFELPNETGLELLEELNGSAFMRRQGLGGMQP